MKLFVQVFPDQYHECDNESEAKDGPNPIFPCRQDFIGKVSQHPPCYQIIRNAGGYPTGISVAHVQRSV